MDRNNIKRLLKTAARRAGIQSNVHPHKLRHTFAIEFLRNGGNFTFW
ncbi:tyrosine-type recombinase/integrase [Chloroflexi bacterium TSY]|nr:tyrosine-type recombinase/integrase [Chloroflexi bacterium TSY]